MFVVNSNVKYVMKDLKLNQGFHNKTTISILSQEVRMLLECSCLEKLPKKSDKHHDLCKVQTSGKYNSPTIMSHTGGVEKIIQFKEVH